MEEQEDNKKLGLVKHYFSSRTDFEVSVNKGDVVIVYENIMEGESNFIVQRGGESWIQCEIRGEIGFVPASFIDLIDELPNFEEIEEEINEEEMNKDKLEAPELPPPLPPAPLPLQEQTKRRNILLEKLTIHQTSFGS